MTKGAEHLQLSRHTTLQTGELESTRESIKAKDGLSLRISKGIVMGNATTAPAQGWSTQFGASLQPQEHCHTIRTQITQSAQSTLVLSLPIEM